MIIIQGTRKTELSLALRYAKRMRTALRIGLALRSEAERGNIPHCGTQKTLFEGLQMSLMEQFHSWRLYGQLRNN